MTSKERAALRSAANTMEVVYQIGKGELDEQLVKGVGEALAARELIKIKVHDNAQYSAHEAADLLAGQLTAQVVQVIGRRFVLYKRNKKVNQYGVK